MPAFNAFNKGFDLRIVGSAAIQPAKGGPTIIIVRKELKDSGKVKSIADLKGMKVAIEISFMAADAGLISTDEEVIAIGGTVSGADTAIVVKPAHAHDAFSLRVKEIICKPRL